MTPYCFQHEVYSFAASNTTLQFGGHTSLKKGKHSDSHPSGNWLTESWCYVCVFKCQHQHVTITKRGGCEVSLLASPLWSYTFEGSIWRTTINCNHDSPCGELMAKFMVEVVEVVWSNSNWTSTDVSQSGCSRHSNWISKCHVHYLQCDTWQHQIQSDGSASRLRLSGVREEFYTMIWQCDCLDGRDDGSSFLMLLCWKAASPAYVVDVWTDESDLITCK